MMNEWPSFRFVKNFVSYDVATLKGIISLITNYDSVDGNVISYTAQKANFSCPKVLRVENLLKQYNSMFLTRPYKIHPFSKRQIVKKNVTTKSAP